MKFSSHTYFLLLTIFLSSCINNKNQNMTPRYTDFADYPVYGGDDLGMQFTPTATTFKLWSPNVQQARVLLYDSDTEGIIESTHLLKEMENGVWSTTIEKNLEGKYYTYQIKNYDDWKSESPDPYSIACGRNGQRSQIIDLSKTNPDGWNADRRPPLKSPNDIIIYEIHVRDMSISQNSGITQKGKFVAFTEKNTKSPEGLATGIDHLKEMGVTHVHLLPSFDFRSVDEKKPEAKRKYNWGYDPHLYNVPEGSYATDAQDGAVRIKEFKQLVQALHAAGIRVILDVVYNHTGSVHRSPFDRLAKRYYFRENENGEKSNASACGNETASERPMVRNFILQSVKYWVEEYHLDGFRFDLMGIHDIETMNLVSETLHKIDPTIFVYGEGWTAGDTPLPVEKRAIKANGQQLNQVAIFSDDIRDGLKGHVFTANAKGFVSGEAGLEESVKFGIVGATEHPQIIYDSVNYSKSAWANQPAQCINYVSCHDNHTLYDRLTNSDSTASQIEKEKMARLALGTVLTSQGIPFLHAGSEFLRTKDGEENSFESSDEINQLDWSRKNEYLSTVKFVQDLIKMRKAHLAFRMKTTEQISKHLKFDDTKDNLISYTINGSAIGDSWKTIKVMLNGSAKTQSVNTPIGNWATVVQDGEVDMQGIKKLRGGKINIPPREIMVMVIW